MAHIRQSRPDVDLQALEDGVDEALERVCALVEGSEFTGGSLAERC